MLLRSLILTIWLAGLAPALAAPCPAAATAIDQDLSAKIDVIVEAAVEDGFAGGVAVVRDGALVYSRVAGFSDAAGRTAVSEETLFHVASVTKYLTAIMALKAAEQGRLDLGAPLGVYFPETRLAARGVTIRDLLAHRSGLGTSYVAEAHSDAASAVAAIDAAEFDESKAGSFHYSNDGYDLLAIILERVYDAPYEEIARYLVLAPACIDEAGFWGETDLTDAAKVGQPLNEVRADLRRRNYGMIGSAGLLITARGLARLQSALAGGYILGEKSLKELFAPRGDVSIGEATYGAFLAPTDKLGPVLNARGFEDWGDNAIMNHYLDKAIIVAVATSKGPAEGAGAPFRNTISQAIEAVLAAP